MQSQRHISPDGLITLVSEPTRTVDAAHPEGFHDWIIELDPGGWHVHPSDLAKRGGTGAEQAAEQFIRAILDDRLTLVAAWRNNELFAVRALDPEWDTLESAIETERANPVPGLAVDFRLWSGRVLARCPE